MARVSKYDDPNYTPPPVPDNAVQLLGAALLGSEFEKKGCSLWVKFDEPDRDLAIVRNVLLAARDNYNPPRD